MKSSPYFLFIIILLFSACIFAQNDRPVPILFATIGVKNADVAVVRERITPTESESSSYAAPDIERQAFDLINAERQLKGLRLLKWNGTVASVARGHSQNMASQKFFSHRGSDGSMVNERADRMGMGEWKAIGENIAFLKGYKNPVELAVEKWLQSPSHRQNLLSDNWKESGVGVVITADGTYYFTQVFLLR